MGFARAYHPLYTVAVQEDGTSAALPGIFFNPTPACRRTLADRQMVFRSRETGFQIYYQTNPAVADSLLGRINSRVRFSFAMVLTASDLLSIFEPDLTDDTGPQFYFDNLTAAGNIQLKDTLSVNPFVRPADAAKIQSPIFDVLQDVGAGAPPTLFRIRDKFDPTTVVLEVPIGAPAGGAQVRAKIDLSGNRSGPYTLETDAPGSVPKTIYVDRDLARSGSLGVLDLYRQTPQDAAPADGLSYFIRFRRR